MTDVAYWEMLYSGSKSEAEVATMAAWLLATT